MSLFADSSCHLCGNLETSSIPDFEAFSRVTSDVKPWPAGGRLSWCRRCGAVQTVLDERWHQECREIYSRYSIYDLAGGAEQQVYDQNRGQANVRSVRLLESIKESLSLAATGRYLDIGCGNGATLRAFSSVFPAWKLTGNEVHDQFRAEVENIPGVEQFVCGDLSEVSGAFDVISLIHVLEHVPRPGAFLERIRERLTPNGLLLVQVPDCEATPFMYVVADHASHFFLEVLQGLIERHGFQTRIASRGVFGKELTVVAARNDQRSSAPIRCVTTLDVVNEQIAWLSGRVKQARTLASNSQPNRPFGLFGTAIAATWMFSETQGRATFFVDEDPNRIGKTHLGRPVLSPAQVPDNSDVHLCQPPEIAAKIAQRFASLPVRWHW